MRLTNSEIDRFWSRVDRTPGHGPKGDCWVWTGGRNGKRRRYGSLCVDGKSELVHRVSFAIHFGSIPSGMCVCHHCDNTVCVNPQHLFAGTQADNMQDCARKHRACGPFGEENGRAKLTETDVRRIRELLFAGFSMNSLGRMFGVSCPTINAIRDGICWRQVQ